MEKNYVNLANKNIHDNDTDEIAILYCMYLVCLKGKTTIAEKKLVMQFM